MAILLHIADLHAHYGHVAALQGINVEISRGEIVTLIGANGAGKSTLLMTIFGHPRASQGQIMLDDKDITQLPTHEIALRGIAQSPEGRRIFPRMTVMENLLMGAGNRKPEQYRKELDYAFELFPILNMRQHQRGGTLSGGEQQMLSIARALMSQPRLLLLDEPSLGLAPKLVTQIFSALKKINEEEKITIFLVEQNAYHALKLAHRGYVMANGKIAMQGESAKLLADESIQQAYLGGYPDKL